MIWNSNSKLQLFKQTMENFMLYRLITLIGTKYFSPNFKKLSKTEKIHV